VLGYVGEARVTHTAPNGVTIDFVPMKKSLETTAGE
jgi:hypothetical protein